MKISTRGPNVQKRHFGASSTFFFKMQGVRTYIRFIKLRTPHIFFIAKPKFDSVHQCSDTHWFFKKYFRAAGHLQPLLEAKNKSKQEQAYISTFNLHKFASKATGIGTYLLIISMVLLLVINVVYFFKRRRDD